MRSRPHLATAHPGATRLRWLAPALGLLALGCGLEPEGEPVPSCVTDPELCPEPLDGGRARTAVVGEAPEGFDAFEPTDPPQAPPTVCPPDRILCDGVCVDPLRDPFHCGECGLACPLPRQACRQGVCCGPDDAVCDGRCVDVSSDENNCGTCGFVCDFETECVLGVCVPNERGF